MDTPSFFSFSFKGRYGRLNYLNGHILIQLVTTIILLLISFIIGALDFVGDNFSLERNMFGAIMISGIIITLISLLSYYWSLRVSVLRCQDMGISRYWALTILFFIPLVGLLGIVAYASQHFETDFRFINEEYVLLAEVGVSLWVLIVLIFSLILLFAPGQPNENDYGFVPAQGSLGGIIFIGILILLPIALVVMMNGFLFM